MVHPPLNLNELLMNQLSVNSEKKIIPQPQNMNQTKQGRKIKLEFEKHSFSDRAKLRH